MFIKNVTIKNYRCFGEKSDPIDFNIPDGENHGSGLTILVGENGTGKTTILEAISYLTENTYFLGNRFSIQDFADINKEIQLKATTDETFEYKLPETFRGSYVNANGFELTIKPRENPSPGKLLSPNLQITNVVTTSDQKATTKSGRESSATLDSFTLGLDPDRLSGINIFYFDRFRTRHISSRSSYKTTFDRVTEDLNWKFLKALKESEGTENDLKQKFSNDFFQAIIDVAQKGAGTKVAEEVKEFFQRDEFEKIRIDFMNLLWPFDNAFFALREDNSLKQVPINKLGAGIELIFSLLFLKAISSVSKGSIVYLIDEPEMSLHPQAQKKLFELLVKESKKNQVIISTHSSYFTEPRYIKNLLRFQKTKDHAILTHRLNDTSLSGDLKENRNFFFRHRDLFFTDVAIFVEGVEDYDRYSKFCESNGYENLLGHFYMMNGCDPTLFFEKFCNQLGINFFAIVDKDFSIQRSKWSRSNRKRTIKDIKDFIRENNIDFNETEFDEKMSQELTEKPRTDERKVEEIEVDGTKIWKVKNKNIFVLRNGEVKDYLDKNGEIVNDDKNGKLKELKAIFKKISHSINSSSAFSLN